MNWPPDTSELILIGIAVLAVFGARKLPHFAKSLSHSIGEFRRAHEEFQRELEKTLRDERDEEPVKLAGLDAGLTIILIAIMLLCLAVILTNWLR